MIDAMAQYGVPRPARKRNAGLWAAGLCAIVLGLAILLGCSEPTTYAGEDAGLDEDPPCSRLSDADYVRTTNSITGDPVFWSQASVSACIPLAFDPVGTADLDNDQTRQILFRSAEAWSNASAGCGASLCFRDGGDHSRSEGLGFSPEGQNHNLLTFSPDLDTWAFSQTAIAVTTTTVAARTGELFDADIDVNDASFQFTDSEPVPFGALDLETVLIHELGHLLGFEHTADTTSIMFPREQAGSARRGLNPDDAVGVCEAFGCYR